jgi:hypothetical protein
LNPLKPPKRKLLKLKPRLLSPKRKLKISRPNKLRRLPQAKRRKTIHQLLTLIFKPNHLWMLRLKQVLLSQLKLSRSQEMQARFKNSLLWRKLLRKPLKRPISKELLWKETDKLLLRNKLHPKLLANLRKSKLLNNKNY